MMCDKFSSEWLAYLDGRASINERERLESHSQVCADCRRRAVEYTQLWNVLDESPISEPSMGFNARIRARVAAEPKQHFWDGLLPTPRLALAMGLLLVLSAWFARVPVDTTTAQSDQDFRMIRDLRVLENYDVLRDFGALSEIPAASPVDKPATTPPGDDQRM
jgi:anti-sigma factor RsiW